MPDERIEHSVGLDGARGHRVRERGLHGAHGEVVGEFRDVVDRLLLGDALADEQPADRDDHGDDRGGDHDQENGAPGRRRAPPPASWPGSASTTQPARHGRDIPRRAGLAWHAIGHVLPASVAVAAVVVRRLGMGRRAAVVVARLGVRGQAAVVVARLRGPGSLPAAIPWLDLRRAALRSPATVAVVGATASRELSSANNGVLAVLGTGTGIS